MKFIYSLTITHFLCQWQCLSRRFFFADRRRAFCKKTAWQSIAIGTKTIGCCNGINEVHVNILKGFSLTGNQKSYFISSSLQLPTSPTASPFTSPVPSPCPSLTPSPPLNWSQLTGHSLTGPQLDWSQLKETKLNWSQLNWSQKRKLVTRLRDQNPRRFVTIFV